MYIWYLPGVLRPKPWLGEQAVKESQLVDIKKLVIRPPINKKNNNGVGSQKNQKQLVGLLNKSE